MAHWHLTFNSKPFYILNYNSLPFAKNHSHRIYGCRKDHDW